MDFVERGLFTHKENGSREVISVQGVENLLGMIWQLVMLLNQMFRFDAACPDQIHLLNPAFLVTLAFLLPHPLCQSCLLGQAWSLVRYIQIFFLCLSAASVSSLGLRAFRAALPSSGSPESLYGRL